MGSTLATSLTGREHAKAREAVDLLRRSLGEAPPHLRAALSSALDYVDRLERDVADLDLVHSMTIEASTALENDLSVRYDAITSFLANTSHELRTPLNAVIGHSELLLEELADENIHKYDADLGRIRDAGNHLLRLMNGLLDLSKVEAGQIEFCAEYVEIVDLVNDVVAGAAPLARSNTNELTMRILAEPGAVYGDPLRIRQCLLNLIGNACKFTRSGKVEVSVSQMVDGRGEWVLVSVQDTGIGMTPEQLSRVFRPYAQADAKIAREYGGTGLGLALTRSLCLHMGADIEATSEPGVGSTFILRLPRELPAIYDRRVGRALTPPGAPTSST